MQWDSAKARIGLWLLEFLRFMLISIYICQRANRSKSLVTFINYTDTTIHAYTGCLYGLSGWGISSL